jgi:hypothetical protein
MVDMQCLGFEVMEREGRGRCVIANRDMKAGECVISSVPYSYLLQPKNWASKCFRCFKRPDSAASKCSACKTVFYCTYVIEISIGAQVLSNRFKDLSAFGLENPSQA